MKQPAIFLVRLCISGMLLAAIAWAQTGDDWRIDTFAGLPELGDNGPAIESRLVHPRGVAVDGAGNVYIADQSNRRIRKVDSSGVITTIAGTGERGFGGDGGPPVEAQLRSPTGVAVDGAGNVYIADQSNRRIRKVDSSGVITTIAGTGERGVGGDDGPAVEAQLRSPTGVAVDSAGNVYIADQSNPRIRKLTPPMTGPVATVPVVPGGSESFSISAVTPYSLTVEWTEPENTGSAITDYDVRYREVGSGGDFTDARHEGTARTATLTGLSPGTAYEVQVRATNATGTGPWSELGEVRTSPQQRGDHIYYFPHLAVGASWQTTITYINYSPQEVSCQTEFLSDHGSPLIVSFAGLGRVVSRSDVLPPGGSVHQETNVELSAPLAPGWALANCSGPVKASLLFRQHNSEGLPVAEAGVNAAAVPATRFVTFAEQGEGQFGTGVAYANPSATAAHVTFTARDADGQILASTDRTLLPGGHDAQGMASLFGLTRFTGSLEVTSTAPIVSLALNFEADPVFSSLPPGELDVSAQGPTTYYFPHLAVGASWQTTITYINYSPQEVSCQTDFISDHGSPLLVSFAGLGRVVSRSDVLPPGGSVHQETNVELSAPLAPGWALATCSGPVKASLLFRQFKGGVAVAEAGVNAAAVPTTRFVAFAEQGEGKFGTGVAYANPSDTAAHVTFTARDADGQTLASVDRALLPNGHDAQGMASLFGLTSFAGSLEVTSTVPIVSLALNFEADPVLSSLPPGEIVDTPDIPADEAAFNNLFVGKRVETNFPTVYVDFVSPGRFRETRGADISTGSYTYRKTGPHTGTLTFNYDDGDRCTVSLTFDSTTTGTATSTCVDGSSVEYDWRLVEIPSDGGQTPIIRSSFPGSPSFYFDSDGAVGPNHYAEITNAGLRVTMLDGTVVYNSDLLQFWRDKAGIPDLLSHVYDPHLEYDYASGRWFAISLAEPSSTDSSLLVGVSDTSDPSAGWKGLVIDADPADLLFADYPYLGIDGAAIYVRFYMLEIADSAPHGADLIVLPKSDLTGAQPVTDHLSRFSFDRLGPVFDREQLARFDLYPFSKPQIDYLGTASDGLQIHSFLNRADAGYPYRITTAYQKMTGQASGEALLTAWADTTFDVESATNPQPQSLPADVGRQPGTDHLLGTNPGNNHIRVGDSVYSVDRAPVGGRQGVVWSRFQPSTNTIVDAGFIGDDAHDYLNMSIAANVDGTAVIAYTRTGPGEYASLYCSVGRPDANGKLVFGPPMLLKAGTDIYDEDGPRFGSGRARFSDYSSAVSVHPWNPSHFWVSGAYVSGRNSGPTWISEIIVPEDGSASVAGATASN